MKTSKPRNWTQPGWLIVVSLVMSACSSTPDSTPDRDRPPPVPGTSGHLGAGAGYTCMRRDDGTLWCWGQNGWGYSSKKGSESVVTSSRTPVQTGSDTDWATVSVGQQTPHTCATKTSGTLWCWGSNGFGEVGDGTRVGRIAPTQVGSLPGWVEVSVGNFHTCARRGDGTLWCWGGEKYVGDGDRLDSYGFGWGAAQPTPKQVGVATDWVEVSARWHHTCARRSDGTLWCWGGNLQGELGDGTTTTRDAPTQVGVATDWAAVSTGYSHTCARKTDGSLWCWGSNRDGELGLGDTTARPNPTQVGADTDWGELSANGSGTCARKTYGEIWCWGRGGVAALQTTPKRPVQVEDADWVEMSVGLWQVCARKTNGTVWCRGGNGNGELGDGTTTARGMMVQVAWPR